MSDNFYDFDKDDMFKDDVFDEVYLKKDGKKPARKEFEVEIPMPKTTVKSTIPAPKQSAVPKKKSVKPKRKKLSSTAVTLCIIGMVVSCLLVFVGSFVAVIFGWNYIPKFEKSSDSVVENIEQIEEYVEVSDDGSYVEVVPMYRETKGDDAPPSSSSTDNDETENSEKDNNNSSSGNDSGTSNADDEIITID